MPDFAPEVDPEVELRHDDPEDVPAPDDLDMEAPEADVAAQRAAVVDEAADEDAAVWQPVPGRGGSRGRHRAAPRGRPRRGGGIPLTGPGRHRGRHSGRPCKAPPLP
ncbi:hypothetical protein ACU686_28755 [Yinghuangia aomiensis]